MGKVRVLCYHRVGNITNDFNMVVVTPQNFRKQMEYLKSNYKILRLEDLDENLESRNEDGVVISFDDGYNDLLYHVYPILEEYQIPATMFIATGNIGTERENWTDGILRAIFNPVVYHEFFELKDELISARWYARTMQEKIELYGVIRSIFQHVDRQKRNEYERQLFSWAGLTLEKGRDNRRMLTAKELRTLSDKSLITIGAHSVTHSSLKQQSVEEQRYEILQSKRKLEEITGKTVDMFAYPFGAKENYSDDTICILKECGYKKAVTVCGRSADGISIYEIPRYCTYNYEALEFERYMECKVFGREHIVEAIQDKTKTKIQYIGRLESDQEIISGKQQILIWGCGYWGMELYQCLKRQELAGNIIAFGDNDCKKIGTIQHDIPVVGMDEALCRLKDQSVAVLVKGEHDWEICSELINKGIQNIHLIIRS